MSQGFTLRERAVLHFNVADFAVAVERVADSSLRQRPLIIAPLQAARAVVYDMSEEAYEAKGCAREWTSGRRPGSAGSGASCTPCHPVRQGDAGLCQRTAGVFPAD